MLAVAEVLEGFDAEAYLQALVAVAQTNGVKDEEVEFIKHQAESLGIAAVDFDQPVDLTAIAKTASSVTCRIILRDCIVVAAADGDFTDSERERINEIAGCLGVDLEVVGKLESWMQRYSDVLKEGQELIAGRT